MRSLRAVSESLQSTQQSLAEAQFRQLRPDDFEPLVEPLREFARAAPSMIEALRRGAPPSPADEPAEALRCVEQAQEALREALADLPEEADYAPVAAQLRELASVSPSLLAWLQEVPRLTAPLRRSVEGLRRAARALESARALLVRPPG